MSEKHCNLHENLVSSTRGLYPTDDAEHIIDIEGDTIVYRRRISAIAKGGAEHDIFTFDKKISPLNFSGVVSMVNQDEVYPIIYSDDNRAPKAYVYLKSDMKTLAACAMDDFGGSFTLFIDYVYI